MPSCRHDLDSVEVSRPIDVEDGRRPVVVHSQQCDVACEVDGMRAVSAATLISIWTALATCQEAIVAGGMRRTGAVLRGDVVTCSRAVDRVLELHVLLACSCTSFKLAVHRLLIRDDVVACSRAVSYCSRASACSCTNLHASDC
jgi:hypothetical protein